jgi:integrase
MARPKRGADGFFSATITIGRDADGKRIRKRIRSKTLSGLREKQQEFERQRAQGLVVHGAKPTLKAFLQDWLEQVVKPRNRPRTYDRYEMDIRNHILPRLGRSRLDQLTPQEVQKAINDLHASGLAPRSVRNVHATLRQALNTALRWGLVGRNVAALVDTPKAEKPQIHALSPDEARRLLNAVRGERLEALYWTALLLGLRQGELLGLRWQDVDLEAQTLRVAGAIQRQKRPDGPSALVFVPTKTQAGMRVLPLPPMLCTILQKHQARQDDERTIDGWQEHNLIFPSERGTPIEATNLVARSFKPALKRAGLPDMPFHGLRHSAATLLIALGVDLNTVSAILGHTSAGFTASVYGHALTEMQQQAVIGLGELLQDPGRVLELPPRKLKQGRW